MARRRSVRCYENGLKAYLEESTQELPSCPQSPFCHEFSSPTETISWAVQWLPEGELLQESYVNLIPTAQGGTHVNGLRTGLTEALREFCELRNLLPRGLKLAPEDLWERCAYVLSHKMQEPQFSGQTKERLASRQAAAFATSVARDAFSLWLNQHTAEGEALAELAIRSAQRRLQAVKGGTSALPRARRCLASSRTAAVTISSGGTLPRGGGLRRGSAKQARDRSFQAVMPLRGKILNTWEVAPAEVLASQEVHDIAVALGVDPGSRDLSGLRYGKVCILADADSDGLHIATLLCALFLRHFPALVEAGRVFVAMPPLYRIDQGKTVYYALDASEQDARLAQLEAEPKRGKIQVQRFKGLGEMNPMQLRETTMASDTRRLVQLTVDSDAETRELMDMLLARKRASDRRAWLEAKGDQAELDG